MSKATKTQSAQDIVLDDRNQVVHVPISMLMPDPNQPRTEFPENEILELGNDMLRRGTRVPLIVRSDYVIEDGERRWRAANMVGIETLPCILALPADDENPDLERLLNQAAINDQRAPLSVLDWSRLLRRLVEEYKMPVKDLPELLEARGFKRLSRPYISNIMRLYDLPDWAQELIRTAQLTPSDGKYLLMANPYPPAMAWINGAIREAMVEQSVKAGAKTVHDELFGGTSYNDDMEELVERAYAETTTILTRTYGDSAPRFNWQRECKPCTKRQQLNNNHYCLDQQCFAQKQEHASKGKTDSDESATSTKPRAKTKPTGPTKVEPNDDGVIILGKMKSDKYNPLDGALRFEPAMHCVGCEHNRLAAYRKTDKPDPTCFNPPCFAEKQRNGNHEEGVAAWLDQRLLPLVEAKLANNYDLQFQVLAWMALGSPTQTKNEFLVSRALAGENRKARKQHNLRTPGAVIQAYANGALNGEAIAAAGVRALLADRAHFYAFARYLGIALTPEIAHLDAEYLDLKRKGELVEMLHMAGFIDSRTGTNTADGGAAEDTKFTPIDKLKLDDLATLCLTPPVVAEVGIPPDVLALYEHLEPVISPDFGDEYEEDEEYVSGETEDDAA